jgi:hypothetical protein
MDAMVEVLLTVWALSDESNGCFRTFGGEGKSVKVMKLFPKRLHSTLKKAIKEELIVADDQGVYLDEMGTVILARVGFVKW